MASLHCFLCNDLPQSRRLSSRHLLIILCAPKSWDFQASACIRITRKPQAWTAEPHSHGSQEGPRNASFRDVPSPRGSGWSPTTAVLLSSDLITDEPGRSAETNSRDAQGQTPRASLAPGTGLRVTVQPKTGWGKQPTTLDKAHPRHGGIHM